ncbi:fumarylacetoacetate hydrolase family protein [Sporolactobacillus sp. CQH2019]|uniref:fumarylacetoacetate hydrolase family protein n=1 Tax=Sporolactobacillus sp. CQH2019 TaxID=3023512 RepID=UPI0023677F76|nr:fumarylacetoacetate hydrolase family protein [Sporolactobacillus sp. CQH2019]MDD9148705.1 fumarylacetoacetate hydrolase family protein [Sporolactobacillus sp. CQH2019]
MKLLQFVEQNQILLGVKTEPGILNVRKAADHLGSDVPVSLDQLFSQGENGIEKLRDFVSRINRKETNDFFIPEESIEFAPAVAHPEKIICVGLNYLNHAKEANMDIPTSPILFSKFNNTLAAHDGRIPIPDMAKKIDYEAELVIVIGKTAEKVSKEQALSYVFGYTAGNDLSARDLQFKTGQWLLGKSPDGFAPVGPYIATGDELDPQNLTIECRVNGDLRQQANTRDMIFDCAALISYISQTITLKPGDIIFTGTPDGVILGYPEAKQEWLKSGDEVAVSIEHIAELKNRLF